MPLCQTQNEELAKFPNQAGYTSDNNSVQHTRSLTTLRNFSCLEKSIGTGGMIHVRRGKKFGRAENALSEVNREALTPTNTLHFTNTCKCTNFWPNCQFPYRRNTGFKFKMGASRAQKEAYFVKLKELVAKFRMSSEITSQTHPRLTENL